MWFWKYHELKNEVKYLHEFVNQLSHRVKELEKELSSGLFVNPSLQEYLTDKVGQTLLVSTTNTSIEGILVTVATDALEVRESTGDLVLIPYSRVTSLQ